MVIRRLSIYSEICLFELMNFKNIKASRRGSLTDRKKEFKNFASFCKLTDFSPHIGKK